MHRTGVAHEVRTGPAVSRKELVGLQVALQPVAGRAGRPPGCPDRAPRRVPAGRRDRASRCCGRDGWRSRRTVGRSRAGPPCASPASSPRARARADGPRRAAPDPRAALLPRARTEERLDGRAPRGDRALRQTQIASRHQRVLAVGDAPNDVAPTEETILTSGRMAMSKGSARCAVARVPRMRTEGVGWFRRWRRRTRAGVGGTQRRRGVPRVERIILLVGPGGVAQQTAEDLVIDIVGRRPPADIARIRL